MCLPRDAVGKAGVWVAAPWSRSLLRLSVERMPAGKHGNPLRGLNTNNSTQSAAYGVD
ncbi:MAG: hypothetical protein QW514_01070 [Thermoprotei archaeon]